MSQIINSVTEGVRESVTERILNPLPTVPETEAASPPPPVGSMPQIHLPPDRVQDYNWEAYILHRTGVSQDYYLTKLFPRFQTVNGTDSYRLINCRLSIIIKDGPTTIFRCRRDLLSNQRNLYLEFHECEYNCEEWVHQFLNNHNLDYENRGSPHYIL